MSDHRYIAVLLLFSAICLHASILDQTSEITLIKTGKTGLSFDLDHHGNIYLLDKEFCSVSLYTPEGVFSDRFQLQLKNARDICLSGGKALILDRIQGIFEFSHDFRENRKLVLETELFYPSSFVRKDSLIFISDYGNSQLVSAGKNEEIWNIPGFSAPNALFCNSDFLYTADWRSSCIALIDRYSGKVFNILTPEPGFFLHIDGIAGSGDLIFVSDWGHNRLVVLNNKGEFLEDVYSFRQSFRGPSTLRIRENILYLLDSYNFRICKFVIQSGSR